MRRDSPPPGFITRLAIIIEGGLVVIAVLLSLLLGLPLLDQVWPTVSAVFWGVLLTVPLLAGLWASKRSRWRVLANLFDEIEQTVVPLFADTSVAGLALISLLAGAGEEALFRGVVQSVLTGPLGTALALVVTSTAFGLLHYVTRTYAIMAGVIGLYLGVLALAFNSLLVPMIVHALYDFVALAYLTKATSLPSRGHTAQVNNS
ncbi:MAG: CPBP family intramembrane metalloprotease [Gemmatimonadetes bacterium]|nr:CPBP family intramembrane metalloprotease [Gemmatimonadota bacterium]